MKKLLALAFLVLPNFGQQFFHPWTRQELVNFCTPQLRANRVGQCILDGRTTLEPGAAEGTGFSLLFSTAGATQWTTGQRMAYCQRLVEESTIQAQVAALGIKIECTIRKESK